MNRNLQGVELGRAELTAIAEAHGLMTSTLVATIRHQHNEALAMSTLIQVTKGVRFAMFCRGELTLDTRRA